jgi:ABC-type sugar transport system substrate-binding protein
MIEETLEGIKAWLAANPDTLGFLAFWDVFALFAGTSSVKRSNG